MERENAMGIEALCTKFEALQDRVFGIQRGKFKFLKIGQKTVKNGIFGQETALVTIYKPSPIQASTPMGPLCSQKKSALVFCTGKSCTYALI